VVLVVAIIGGLLALGWGGLRVWGHHSALNTARQQLESYIRLASEHATLEHSKEGFVSVALQTQSGEPVHVRMLKHNPQTREWHLLDGGWAMPARIRVEASAGQSVYEKIRVITTHGDVRMLEGTWFIIEFNHQGALKDGKPCTLFLVDDTKRTSITISPTGYVSES
ncbi:MAG TPA: hypothetical protein PLV25_03300, partial [Opitutales bacterium]|nr:hypothetical protein [Opitutales bacterium]